MLTAAVILGAFMFLNVLLVGGVIGYLTYGYLATQAANAIVPDHPEFFDEDGNMINEELITIRFEDAYGQMLEWDDEE